MFSTLRLQASNSAIDRKCTSNFARNRTLPSPAAALRIPSSRRFTVLSFQLQQNGVSSSEPSISSGFTSSVGSPPLQLSQYTLTQRHVNVLYVAACAVSSLSSPLPLLLNFAGGYDLITGLRSNGFVAFDFCIIFQTVDNHGLK